MAEDADAGEVVDNAAEERFELRRDGATAVVTYHRDGDLFYILHTEVPPELEGRGLGGRMVRFALDHARGNGLRVVAMCPFAKTWVQRHAAYHDLLAST
jgi:predicted GNAT family acetyltransferase